MSSFEIGNNLFRLPTLKSGGVRSRGDRSEEEKNKSLNMPISGDVPRSLMSVEDKDNENRRHGLVSQDR